MQADFWHERWRSGRTGFHQRAVTPALQNNWPTLDLPRGCAVFVPLCGKSLDMLWLRDQPHEVLGVELSDVAVEAFCMENGIAACRARSRNFDEYRAAKLQLLCGDFFCLDPQTLGRCAAVYDRAALISWAPALRKKYVAHLTRLTAAGCQTLLIALEYPQTEMSGPPFCVDADCVDELYSAQHRIRVISREDILAEDPKLKARGVTQLHEVCYHLTRL